MNRKRVLYGLFLVGFLQNLFMTASGGIIPIYLKVLGASELLVGISYAWFSLVRGGTSLVSGLFTDRLNRRDLLLFSQLGFALANLAYALVGTPNLLAALRLIQGLTAGLYWVVILSMVADASEPEQRLRNLTWFNIGIAISGVGANWLGGYFAEHFSPRFVFTSSLIAFLGVSLFVWKHFRRESLRPAATARPSLREIFNVPRQVKLISLLAGSGMIAETVNTMAMSLFVYGVGGGYQDVGLIAGLIVGAGLFCQLLAPTLQRRIGYRGIIVLVYTVNALLLLLLFWQRSLLAAYLLFPVIGALFTLPSLAWLTLAQATANPGQTGAATGFFRGTFDLTSVIYYLACGALSARFTVVPLLAGAAVVLLCLAFLTWRLTFLDAGAASQRLPRRGKSSPKQVS